MRILLGLSGGVDSAVAAYLLKKQGHDVICCFMRNWDSITNGDILGNPTLDGDMCSQEKDYLDAIEVAKKLNLPLIREDFIDEYWDNVFSYLIEEYKKGRTPNPDVFCNKYIKFGSFYNVAKKHNCEKIAMGHYAKRVDENGKTYLLKAKDKNKDQSYFLSQISYEQLTTCLFPLGDILKTEVRKIAHELDLTSVEDKKDSTGICFVGERKFKDFLKNYIPAKSGDIVDINTNKVIGKHDGVMYYTLGQRKGLGIGGIKGITSNRWFVCKKDVKNNILYVANGSEDSHLLTDKAILTNINILDRDFIFNKTKLMAKFRYRQEDKEVFVTLNSDNTFTIDYALPYKAITPGQICVLYNGEICVGSGIIDKVYFNNELKS